LTPAIAFGTSSALSIRCVILSVTCLLANLSPFHVNANTNRHVNANTNLIRHVLTLSAVHQWVGYLVVA
jgi:hypothetical protein